MLYHRHRYHHHHRRFFLLLLFLIALLLVPKSVAVNKIRISNEEDFFTFLNNVNRGTNYEGTTTYLDSDLSLPNIVDPIGKQESRNGNEDNRNLIGTFDGQGHVIRDLVLNTTTTRSIGLFGYSEGLVIRNVVLDSSCSIASSYNTDNAIKYTHAGGILGYCYAIHGPCVVENTINMASVTFNGIINSYVYIGGIIGEFTSSSLSCKYYVKNCVNYGPVTHSGTSYQSRIGGIIGQFHFSNGWYKYLYNCLNYGTITHSGTTTSGLHLGGITGRTFYAYVENCLSVGKISLTTEGGESNIIGSIAGYVSSYTHIDHCYYTDELSEYDKYGFIEDIGTLYESNTPNTSANESEAVSNLNNQVTPDNGWNKWIFNTNNKIVAFKANNNEGFFLTSQVIILPDLASDLRNFSGWFMDSAFTTPFSASSVSDGTTLYGKWDNYTLTFDYGNGTIVESVLEYNASINYPGNITREGYKFVGWDTKIEFMPAYDLTITARWKETSSSSLDSIVIGVVVVIIAIIIAIAVVLLVFLRRRNDYERSSNRIELRKYLIGSDRSGRSNRSDVPTNRYYSRAAEMTRDDTINNVTTTTTITTAVITQDDRSIFYGLYPDNYTKPTMKDALLAGGLSEKQAETLCDSCEETARKAMQDCITLSEEFTEEDAMAIAMYTYDFGVKNFEHNPYRIINKSIAEGNRKHLQKASGLLYLVMTALRKLPRVTGITLYRGVRSKVNLDEDHYYEGNVIPWLALSSTSPDMNATKRFLAKGSKKDKSEGTLFIIEGGWGYDIRPYSMFPNEDEILLEPERQFKVNSIIQTDGLTFINLQMLDTPLSLTKVFGSGCD